MEEEKKDEEIDSDQIENDLDDFFKQGGLDIGEMEATKNEPAQPPKTAEPADLNEEKSEEQSQREAEAAARDTEPDESMSGYMVMSSSKVEAGSGDPNLINNVVDGIG